MKKKVLFISHDSSLQGAERCLLDLVSHLNTATIDPLVLIPWAGPLEDKLTQLNIRFIRRHVDHWIPSKNRGGYRHFFTYIRHWRAHQWSLLHLIEKEGIDLVYSNTSTVIDGAIAARRAGIPHIWHIHEYIKGNPDLHSYLPARCIDRVIANLSNCIIVPSSALANDRFQNATNKTVTVANGTDVHRPVHTDCKQIREAIGIPPDAPVITLIGGLSVVKDPLTFIKAAGIIVRDRADAHFLLIGTASDRSVRTQLEQLIQQLGLKNNCHLLGFREDISDLLLTATVHVSTSIQESFGRTLIEAMAAATPVVATRCGGPEEVIEDGKTGFIVQPKNPEAIAKAVLQLISTPAMARSFGDAGQLRAKALFSVEQYASTINEIITTTGKT